ncbi:MAG: hypothetical protein OXS29_13615 [bacterium]|nr:hypothetical protein [bacterium]
MSSPPEIDAVIVPRDTANVPPIVEGRPEFVNDDDPDTDMPAGMEPEYEYPVTRESEYVGNCVEYGRPTV